MFSESFKVVLTNMIVILVMSIKLATLNLLNTKIFWNKAYDATTSVRVLTNKIWSCESNNVVYVVLWPKLGNSSLSIWEIIITSILQGFDQKNQFF